VSPAQPYLAQAGAARQRGDIQSARRLLEQAVASDPAYAPAHNSLGLTMLGAGDASGAVRHFTKAAELDPRAPPVWLNLAEALRVLGRPEDELVALDRALAVEPYLLPALFRKGQAFERLDRLPEAARTYKAMLAIVGEDTNLPPTMLQALAHARKVVAHSGQMRAAQQAGILQEISTQFAGQDLARAKAYADHLAGQRKVYQQQPTAGHFPYLPALEFFSRELFPWFAELEAQTAAIRSELLSVWTTDAELRPYVRFDAATPANQWAELNHSADWSAYFLWEDGRAVDDHLSRCPATAAALARAPLLDIEGRAPTAMFSILKPRTRIPAHTGSSNIRTTVHLPLVVPDGCGFRVGAETREWRTGEAWAFDDTIEHEAWNKSDQPRAILILDVWNPLLTEVERAAVRALG
jgi:aspartyl/asparaginyl beta-hydroxylase (cupin superfamily)